MSHLEAASIDSIDRKVQESDDVTLVTFILKFAAIYVVFLSTIELTQWVVRFFGIVHWSCTCAMKLTLRGSYAATNRSLELPRIFGAIEKIEKIAREVRSHFHSIYVHRIISMAFRFTKCFFPHLLRNSDIPSFRNVADFPTETLSIWFFLSTKLIKMYFRRAASNEHDILLKINENI